jgi:hypothetical protein
MSGGGDGDGAAGRSAAGQLPAHKGKCLRLSVLEEEGAPGAEGEEVYAEVEGDGGVHSCAEPPAEPTAWDAAKSRPGSRR